MIQPSKNVKWSLQLATRREERSGWGCTSALRQRQANKKALHHNIMNKMLTQWKRPAAQTNLKLASGEADFWKFLGGNLFSCMTSFGSGQKSLNIARSKQNFPFMINWHLTIVIFWAVPESLWLIATKDRVLEHTNRGLNHIDNKLSSRFQPIMK